MAVKGEMVFSPQSSCFVPCLVGIQKCFTLSALNEPFHKANSPGETVHCKLSYM